VPTDGEDGEDFMSNLDEWMEERFADLRGGSSQYPSPSPSSPRPAANGSSTIVPFAPPPATLTRAARRLERRIARQKARALREAAKVAVDYRPVMSTIIDDYLFRCPSWRFASGVAARRKERERERREVRY
jgi:hypothetical protein